MAPSNEEEVSMAALAKKTRSRFAGWFKKFSEKNKPLGKWYEQDVTAFG
jgi:hypothetical protein